MHWGAGSDLHGPSGRSAQGGPAVKQKTPPPRGRPALAASPGGTGLRVFAQGFVRKATAPAQTGHGPGNPPFKRGAMVARDTPCWGPSVWVSQTSFSCAFVQGALGARWLSPRHTRCPASPRGRLGRAQSTQVPAHGKERSGQECPPPGPAHPGSSFPHSWPVRVGDPQPRPQQPTGPAS